MLLQTPPAATARAARQQTPPADASENNAVLIRNVSKRFGDQDVLRDINLAVGRGEFLALLGASGAGKTTLLRTLAGIEKVDRGSVVVPKSRSVVFQEARLVSSLRVWQNVVIGLPFDRAARAQAMGALEEVGLVERADAWPHTLSGGEAQRVALARALTIEPGLLLLDEPFASLDALTRLRMHDLVIGLWRRHRPAVLLVTHDVDEAIALADRVAVMLDGRCGLEEAVDLPRPRTRREPRFIQLRELLLTTLGVVSTA
jgi:sulfonate transport system ATP-binding protein